MKLCGWVVENYTDDKAISAQFSWRLACWLGLSLAISLKFIQHKYDMSKRAIHSIYMDYRSQLKMAQSDTYIR